jgi:hypothetical protein
LIVNPGLLRLEAFDGSSDDFIRKFWRHVFSCFSSLNHLGTTPYRKSAEAIPAFFHDGRLTEMARNSGW